MGYKDKEVQKEYQKKWIASRRKSFFDSHKCKECNSDEDLQLHHRDTSKKESHSIWSWSKERREFEIEKCDVLCRSCHLKAHGKVLGGRHGTVYRYRKGCKCDGCSAAQTKQRRARYARTGK